MKPTFRQTRTIAGFTLIELLIVITIIAILVALVMTGFNEVKKRAAAAKRLNDIKQAGQMLIAKAPEQNGRLIFLGDGVNPKHKDLPYNLVLESQGINPATAEVPNPIMHFDVKNLPATGYQFECYGINYMDVVDNNVAWQTQVVVDGTETNTMRSLKLLDVRSPGFYPLLMDSSKSDGKECYRIIEGNGELVGLRYNTKANALFLDGSARSLDKEALKKAGFTKAYDNTESPPTEIGL